jgi:mono/diheme cytochrome c family protein
VLYVAAGLNDEVDGLYARIDLGATAPDIVAPTGVALTQPAAASTLSGSVDVAASASDNVGVARVVFSVRAGTTTTEFATDTTAPFGATLNSGTVANGPATLLATAFDAYGNSTVSPGIAVTVNNVADTTPPAVNLTAPVAGDVSGTIAVSANATDNVGVAQVQFFAGATSLGTATTAPYTVQWNTATFSGAQQLTAVARDGAGNSTTSAAVAVTVINSPTLAQLQASVFSPRCSGCHTGGGSSLPASMDLTSASATHASLVNVNSVQTGMPRVAPGNPNGSYVIHKLEGTQTVGQRMPAGGPFLDQATIDQIRAWIQAGAAP